jgi:hypothetical protein
MSVDVKTATTVKVGFENVEQCVYLTFFVSIQVKYGAKFVSTRDKDVDLVIL